MLKYIEYFLNANAVRILKLIFGVFILAHWTTCAWYLLNHLEEGNTWLHERGLISASVSALYIETLHSVFLMLFRNMDVHPVTTAENAFAIIVILLGAVMYATIFGSIAVVIANFDEQRVFLIKRSYPFWTECDSCAFLTTFRSRCFVFTTACGLCSGVQMVVTNSLISELSPSLATEVLCSMHMDTLKKVPFFSEFSEIVVHEICFKLKAQVYSRRRFHCPRR